MVYEYPRARYVTSVLAQDAVLLVAIAFATWSGGALGGVLAMAGATTLLWGLVTLHFPSKVEVTDEAITFSAYGRTHVFAWRDVTHIRVRRFLVKDRVLVRLAPATVWRGRYWLTNGLGGWDALICELERRKSR